MNVAVGLAEGLNVIETELIGSFRDDAGNTFGPGRQTFMRETALYPVEVSSCAFAIDDITIGIGFHWERKERQVFRGSLRIVRTERGLTAINDVSLEEYVASVISSEMSASCPMELLKAHAVISRSWMWFPKEQSHALQERAAGQSQLGTAGESREIIRWYGREAHPGFDVCADDHCQRYQGITKAFSPSVSDAVRATAGEFLFYDGSICDARFSKSCGAMTEVYSTAWDDQDIPYLTSLYDGPGPSPSLDSETLIRSNVRAYCNTRDSKLLSIILPGFDQETQDFYRWCVEYTPEETQRLIQSKLNVDLGPITGLQPLSRGPSGRIHRLKITGERGDLVIGKELEIRRALSPSHLYSSAFVVDREAGKFILRGAGWGHGVGLCQIGAAVMATQGKNYREILGHYYRGAGVATF